MTVPSDDAKYRSLFEENYALMRDYCLRRLSTDDTNDALADIFLVAWRKFASIPAGDDARLWLYGVARNVVANQQRSGARRSRLQSRLKQLADRTLEPGTETQVIRRSQDEELLRAVGRMNPEEQELLRLKMWEELGHAEIGIVFGISAHAVDMRLSRATKKLAKLVRQPTARVNPRPITEGGER